ncbi:DUF1690-domain-containing protein [Trichodelitschia bisporula]|uniref:DUF1690-domain-containing protein n=1 Tax=Trichodelitschia bisporula TaxID=703511 RepID=A0A6G1I7E9_9PEZI|nr:DUF1690-domain-containing protein [Trichodelitschia bisporula]
MGADQSKPLGEPTQHVFASETPTRFSGELVNKLQESTQSDGTRSADLELKIQSRVAAELERLADEEALRVAETISKADSGSSSDTSVSLLDKVTGEAAEKERRAQLSNGSVTKEIEALKQKLAHRKKLDKVDPAVESAKEELVLCLRLNDRRPLDCWKEKEAFKKAVARLEQDFVDRTLR